MLTTPPFWHARTPEELNAALSALIGLCPRFTLTAAENSVRARSDAREATFSKMPRRAIVDFLCSASAVIQGAKRTCDAKYAATRQQLRPPHVVGEIGGSLIWSDDVTTSASSAAECVYDDVDFDTLRDWAEHLSEIGIDGSGAFAQECWESGEGNIISAMGFVQRALSKQTAASFDPAVPEERHQIRNPENPSVGIAIDFHGRRAMVNIIFPLFLLVLMHAALQRL